MEKPRTHIADLMPETQPESCKKFYSAGWRFSYCSKTRFVFAEHPHGGKQSIVEVLLIGQSEFDANEIGQAIATMLNGESRSDNRG